MKYLIRFKEFGRKWSSTSYSAPYPVSEDYLVNFFALYECEEYEIVKEDDESKE